MFTGRVPTLSLIHIWCTFCKAAVKCRARAEAKLQLAKYEFAMSPLLTDAEIEDILSRLPGLTK